MFMYVSSFFQCKIFGTKELETQKVPFNQERSSLHTHKHYVCAHIYCSKRVVFYLDVSQYKLNQNKSLAQLFKIIYLQYIQKIYRHVKRCKSQASSTFYHRGATWQSLYALNCSQERSNGGPWWLHDGVLINS